MTFLVRQGNVGIDSTSGTFKRYERIKGQKSLLLSSLFAMIVPLRFKATNNRIVELLRA